LHGTLRPSDAARRGGPTIRARRASAAERLSAVAAAFGAPAATTARLVAECDALGASL